MFQILLFTLIVGAFSADPLRGNIPGSHQQQDGQTEEQGRCGAHGECSAGPLLAVCEGSAVKWIPTDCPTTIMHITFRKTSVTTIPDGAFERYTELNAIKFTSNSLQRIGKGAFRGLSNLDDLQLTYNELSDSSFGLEPFEGLSSLTKVYLEGNRLTTFPLHLFGNAGELQYFDTNSNQINDMGPEINFFLDKLTTIDLSINKLTSLKASMFHQTPNIVNLNFFRNQISVIHNGNAFTDLPSLQTLNIGSNPLHCDCTASWMVESKESWATNWDIITACAAPKWMAGKGIIKLYPQDISCEPPVITPITPTNISHTRNTAFTLQATMVGGFPYSTWVDPDGRTENAIRMLDGKFDIEVGRVIDDINDKDHSVVTSLKMDSNFDRIGRVSFTLVATNVAGDSELTFWVYIDPAAGGAGGGPPVYTGTLLLLLMYTMVITE